MQKPEDLRDESISKAGVMLPKEEAEKILYHVRQMKRQRAQNRRQTKGAFGKRK